MTPTDELENLLEEAGGEIIDMTPTNSELRQKLIQLYEKGADSVLIDWKRDDTKPLIEEIEALIDKQIIEARAEGHHKGRYELAQSLIPELEKNLTKYEGQPND